LSIFPLDSVQNAGIDQEVELTLEELRRDLESFSFIQAGVAFTSEEILEVFDVSRARLNVLARLLKHMRGKTGADISAGFGFLSVALSRQGIEVRATEMDVGLAEFAAAHGVQVAQYQIGAGQPPFPPESLDFVVLSEVIEHLRAYPLMLFRKLASLLKVGGLLVVTTPNVARLANIEALAAGENFLEPFPEDVSLGDDVTAFLQHVREYSVREMVEALEGAGLAVEQALMTGWGARGYDPPANPYVNEIMVITATK
jgi:2-polyprenyl-3-methyl-5-hydroxy-6-metoxy-1,4-benzoquinol methylase